MKLTTKALTEEFKKFPFHSQEGLGGAAHVLCRFRLPSEKWAFYVLEAEPMTLQENEIITPKIKGGPTWLLRGIVFNVQHPFGKYTLFVLAELEQTKVFTELKDNTTGEPYYIEESAERDKEFMPCRVDEVVEHMDRLTADMDSEYLFEAKDAAGRIMAAARKVINEAGTEE